MRLQVVAIYVPLLISLPAVGRTQASTPEREREQGAPPAASPRAIAPPPSQAPLSPRASGQPPDVEDDEEDSKRTDPALGLRYEIDADDLARALVNIPLQDPLDGWRGDARAEECREFQGDRTNDNVDDQWGVACAVRDSTMARELYFYPHAGTCCTLQKAVFTFLSAEADETRLIDRLSQELGHVVTPPAEDASALYGDHCCASALWSWGGREVALSRARAGHVDSSPSLRKVTIRDPELLALIREEWRGRIAAEGAPRELDRLVNRRLAHELKDLEPDYAEIMSSGTPDRIHQALIDMLDRASVAEGAMRSALNLASDRLAERLAQVVTQPIWRAEEDEDPATTARLQAESRRYREVLKTRGLTYTTYVADDLYYSNDLLWTVWRDENARQWREDTFALLQDTGWETGPYCGSENANQFRAVIDHGEPFLASSPDGPFAMETRLALARAYETWWSLSRAGSDPYVQPSPEAYEDGADEARRKAIGYYKTFLQAESTGFRAWDAARRLERLVLGLDTDQRIYHCIWD